MRRPRSIAVYVVGAWICGNSCRLAAADHDYAFYHENVMGTSLELKVRAEDAESARGAEDRVLRAIDRLSGVLSGYDPASEFSRWRGAERGPVAVSSELFDVLEACDRWRSGSGGAFDPQVQAVTRLWLHCAKLDRTPSSAERNEVKALMSRPAWRLDPRTRTAARLSDCPLTLDAIAKGYIVERASEAAMGTGRGVRGLLLNVGGDLRVCGEDARTIEIALPTAGSETLGALTTIEVRDRAVATSGNAHRGVRIGGAWYSHIIDPRSCAPVDAIASATVIAPRSADADALATIFNVLAPGESLRLARSIDGVECLIVTTDGRIAQSDGWHRYEKTRPAPIVLADDSKAAVPKAKPEDGQPGRSARTKSVGWGEEFELFIGFEINRPAAEPGRYRRPYVAVWVEDKDGFPVRNLALWVSLGGPGPFQWLPDLKRWYRADQARRVVDKTDLIGSFAQPTRPAGKHSVIWDGKDDHGKPVARGEYTVFIDAAREHGTYQSIRKRVTIADAPFAEELKGNVEIKSASIAYRRKPPGR